MAWYSRITKAITNFFTGGPDEQSGSPAANEPYAEEETISGGYYYKDPIDPGDRNPVITGDEIADYTINSSEWMHQYSDGGDYRNIEKVYAFYYAVLDRNGRTAGRIKHDTVKYLIDYDDLPRDEAIEAMREITVY